MKFIGVIVSALFLLSCSGKKFAHPHVIMETEKGDIEIELYEDKAPKSVAAFLKNVDDDLYRNCSFYRVLNDDNQPSNAPKSELIQGGIWKSNYAKSQSLPRIPHETTEQTQLHHTDGTISLARLEPGTAGSEFFICVGDQPGFDYGGKNNADGQGYAAFGKVVEGMPIVRKIYRASEEDQQFTPPIMIYKIRRRR